MDSGQIVKAYDPPAPKPASTRYSPGHVVSAEVYRVFGNPDSDAICTSYVEQQNLTLRMHCRRLTRLTNAFRKKLANFEAAVALNFAHYNFCLRHATLRSTPAMAAGVAANRWTVAQLLDAVA